MKRKIKIETREIIFTIIGIFGVLLWFVWGKNLFAPLLNEMPILLAFPIFYFFIFLFVFLLSSILVGKWTKLRFSFIVLSILIGLQLFVGPYFVSEQGVINKEVEYYFIETDNFIASFWNVFGISGNLLWWFVYPVSIFVFLFLIPILLLGAKKISKLILDGFAR